MWSLFVLPSEPYLGSKIQRRWMLDCLNLFMHPACFIYHPFWLVSPQFVRSDEIHKCSTRFIIGRIKYLHISHRTTCCSQTATLIHCSVQQFFLLECLARFNFFISIRINNLVWQRMQTTSVDNTVMATRAHLSSWLQHESHPHSRWWQHSADAHGSCRWYTSQGSCLAPP